jgi:hypothetical protein
MKIVWSDNEKRFEAQFAPGENWQTDKDAAQSAGFKTDGPPAWIWHVSTASALALLKKALPSGITITREALDAYNHLQQVEQKNAELKAYIKEQKKLQKKAQEHTKIEAQREDIEEGCKLEPAYEPQHYHAMPEYWKGKDEITRADLPADIVVRSLQHEPIPQRRAEMTARCVMCNDPIYFYEKQDPPTCLWCETQGQEKFLDDLLLDNNPESATVDLQAGIQHQGNAV